MTKIAEALHFAQTYLGEKNIDNPRLEAEVLLSESLNLSRAKLYIQFEDQLSIEQLSRFKNLLKRRGDREPLAYILKRREFFSLDLEVSEGVLVPRPETEELVEMGLSFLNQQTASSLEILDLGTGSGCILLSLLVNCPSAKGIGMDVSSHAIEQSQRNALRLGLADRVRWIQHDLKQKWPETLIGPFDLITANLPYIPEGEFDELMPEVKNYEPCLALIGGDLGIEIIIEVFPYLSTHLKPNGLAIFEMAWDQGHILLEKIHSDYPDLHPEIVPDLSQRDRFLVLRKVS